VVVVDNRKDTRDFLASRRARITLTPEHAGLPGYGRNRRVPGQRREEVALLAGVSVDYYTRLERGNLNGVSDTVLEALARALQLDEAERAHLFDLARAANSSASTRRRPSPQRIRPGVQRILDAITGATGLGTQRPHVPRRQPDRLRALLTPDRQSGAAREQRPATQSSATWT
jgi:transcriptional regulator with XRE-family HTH domain